MSIADRHPTPAPTISLPAPGTLCDHCAFHDGNAAAALAVVVVTCADGHPMNMCAADAANPVLLELACQSFDDKPFPYEYAPGELDDVMAAAAEAIAALSEPGR